MRELVHLRSNFFEGGYVSQEGSAEKLGAKLQQSLKKCLLSYHLVNSNSSSVKPHIDFADSLEFNIQKKNSA